ncbi:DDE-type integrase/transposase/recombinase [Paenibacillus maysiensis]|uniref:DDE-type integrase/transposase/recombinase n=1 Tax=Paenibacillus maysiensis TaxID=1155954 RepID=UPI0006765E07
MIRVPPTTAVVYDLKIWLQMNLLKNVKPWSSITMPSESEENVQIMHRIEHEASLFRLSSNDQVPSRARLRDQSQACTPSNAADGLRGNLSKPNLSKRLHAKYTRPYLLHGLTIERPNQVWGIDITYIRMGKGFMYLFNIIDWYSRKVITAL